VLAADTEARQFALAYVADKLVREKLIS